MPSDKFEIRSDVGNGLLRIALRGNWDVETIREYKEAVTGAVAALYEAGKKPGQLVALVDTREAGAQSQEVIAAYQKELGSGSGLAPRKLATLVSSHLLKRQVERIAMPNQRLFTEERDALTWLLSDTASEPH